MRKTYAVNAPEVVDEVFEDEIVVINFDSGNYYSLRQSAIDIWEGLGSGMDADAIAAMLCRRYEVGEAEAAETVASLLERLEADALVRPSDAAGREEAVPEVAEEKKPFAPPLYEKFTDMSDLLVLDPMHDVDENGWPYVEPKE